MTDARPILYSFRRCPYAMRGRMALDVAGIAVEHREILLKDKPAEMLAASPKGTVPVIVRPDGGVIEESLDVMLWALEQNDPENWLTPPSGDRSEMEALIGEYAASSGQRTGGTARGAECDLASLASVRAFADSLKGAKIEVGEVSVGLCDAYRTVCF